VNTYLLAGFVNGSLYALLAVGVVLVYQVTGVLNFAFGAFALVAAFTFSTLTFDMDERLALVLVVVGSMVVGAIFGRITVAAQASSPVVKAIATLGLISILQGFVAVVWGGEVRPSPFLANSTAFHAFDLAVTWQRVLSVAVALVGAGLAVAFFRFGRLGSALRAAATSTEVSRLVGLPVRTLWVLSWTLSTAVAAIVAVLIVPETGLDPISLTFIPLVPLAAALAARFRSIGIAFVAAIGLGILQGAFQGNETLAPYRDVLPLGLVIGSLVLFPTNRTYERV
jgi:branched-subunit amino acid ABC-type transport system permease component